MRAISNVARAGASISYARLRKDSLRFASFLRNQLGLKPSPYKQGGIRDPILSPVVLVHLPNSIPFVVCELGTWAAGLTVGVPHFPATLPSANTPMQHNRQLRVSRDGIEPYHTILKTLSDPNASWQRRL